MLSRKRRISKGDFKEVFGNSALFYNTLFTLRVRKYPEIDEDGRFAVVVPASVTKSKPTRNLLRRRIYEIVAKNKVKTGIKVIIFVKKEALKSSFGELKNYLDNIFALSKIFR